jgi:transcriptional repressor NrdR
MKCPYCRKSRTRVLDSRSANRGLTIRRRRECARCRRRFTTYERPGEKLLHVVKRDGSREIFDRDKLGSGIRLACNKRPVTDRQIERAIEKVERDVFRRYSGEVSSQAIGDLVLRELKRLDKVAYVRFASVYRSFTDVDQFIVESRAVKKR